ncbi:N-acetyltransferase [Geothrix limicola]|uniref:N-acetyltransferase n=1 Tax=Geothrix limicola TaxID=2927978 RepID=A0ABQ5QI82_9BACT|nr:N-acetyltransferase [Geothrix limicola]GLH74393.1 N-acetyltransferase [Geothrix limicola]
MSDPAKEQTILVREARPADVEAIADIGRRSFTWAFGHLYQEAGLARYLEATYAVGKIAGSLSKPANLYLVAEVEGAVRGFLKLKVAQPGAAWQVQKLYIDPDLIQRGLGGQLMRAGEARMLEGGAGSAWLVVYTGNARAIRFYTDLGYEVTGPVFHDFEELRVEFKRMERRYGPAPTARP